MSINPGSLKAIMKESSLTLWKVLRVINVESEDGGLSSYTHRHQEVTETKHENKSLDWLRKEGPVMQTTS